MKAICLFALLLFSSLKIAQAQIHEAGLKGGVNFANLAGDVFENQMKIGPSLGGYLNIHLVEELYIQAEAFYSLQGTAYRNKEINVDYKDHLHYVNVPVLAKYFITDDISLHAGIYLGGLLAAKRKGNSFGTTIDQKLDHLTFLDFGLALGGGYRVHKNLTVGARYNFGIANIYKNEHSGGEGYDYSLKLHNRVLQIFAAIPLYLPEKK